MKRFIGIDQSYTSCGVVVLNEDGSVHSFDTIKTVGEDIFLRARQVAQELETIVNQQHNLQTIGIEGLAFSKFGNATRDLAGLQFVIMNTLRHELGQEVKIVSPNSLKKFATGSGKAKKQEMVDFLPEHVIDLFKQEYKKSNGLYDVADAYWIAKYVLDESHQPATSKSKQKRTIILESALEPKHTTREEIINAVKTVLAETNSK